MPTPPPTHAHQSAAAQRSARPDLTPAFSGDPAAASPADALCKAAARGDLPAVSALLSNQPALSSCVDVRGFYPLAWAALNDQPAVLAALLRSGASRSARDPAGQTALHWSAARGAVAAAEALLADAGGAAAGLLAAPDAQGYTPLHVASQHDAPAWLHRAARAWPGGLVGVRAARDAHDRTPLHWASYKGAASATRLLLVLGADPTARDDEGATPLHWAALKGHLDTCLLLVRASSAGHRVGGAAVLGMRDATGATPADLAMSKGHTSLATRLGEEASKAGIVAGGGSEEGGAPLVANAWRRPSSGRPGRPGWAAARLGSAVCVLAWAFEARVVWAPGAPPPSQGNACAGLLVGVLVAGGCALLAATVRADPGLLPVHPSLVGGAASASGDGPAAAGASSSSSSHPAAATVPPTSPDGRAGREPGEGSTDVLAHPAFAHRPHAAANVPDWARLCVACRSVRPLRAKHCGSTGACVTRYDHYCPWTGCVIGGGNLGPFVGMLACFAGAACLSGLVAAARLVGVMGAMDGLGPPPPSPPPSGSLTGAATGIGLFLIFDGAVALAVGVLACVQAQQLGSNLTTAEAVGGPGKHPYLRGPTGRGFVNPFDTGSWLGNWRAAVGGWAVEGGAGASPTRRGGRPGPGARGGGGRARGVVDGGAPTTSARSSPPGLPGRRPGVNRGVEMV